MKRSSLYRTIGLCLALAVVAQGGFAQTPRPIRGAEIDGEPIIDADLFPTHIIGVGMAFDDDEEPATIDFLYKNINEDLLEPGDIVLEYRGHRVSTGAELYNVILDLPDVAPGETVEIVLFRPRTGEVVAVDAVSAALVTEVTKYTFPDRMCSQEKGVCLCKKELLGSTCIRKIHSEIGADGKTISTSSSCDDGNPANLCPPPPPPPPAPAPAKKKGK